MPFDRDEYTPKTAPAHVRAQTDVPIEIPHEPVTGRFDTLAEEDAARIQREIREQTLRGQRALAIKVSAGFRVIIRELRALSSAAKASELERERRSALDERARERKAALQHLVVKWSPRILVAIAGIMTAYAKLRGRL